LIRGGRLVAMERFWSCAAGALGIGTGDVAAGRLRQAAQRKGVVLENSAASPRS
jgi:hypothetical protein